MQHTTNEKSRKAAIRALCCLVPAILILLTSCGGGGSSSSATATSDSNSEYSVSGTISVTDAIAYDSDTNDPSAAYAANDSAATAQQLAVPVTVGGYVNRAGYGPAGRSYSSGDPKDFYQVTLAADQTVALRFSTSYSGNLDLFIYDSNGDLYDSSQGTRGTETIQVADEGLYSIEVRATSGAAIYTLNIGQSYYTAGAEELHLSDDFVPGELIVNYVSTAAAASIAGPSRLGLQTKAGAPGRPQKLSFSDHADKDQLFARLGASRVAASLAAPPTNSAKQRRLDTITLVQALRQRSDIASADLNYRRYRTQTPDDPYYNSNQYWNYEMIGLPEAWDTTTGSDDVTVAVIDTGVLLDHPDLEGRLISGYDFIKDSSSANDGDGIDADPSDPGDDTAGDSSFHGTHVAGIIAAASDNATGVAGVTWSGKIMPLRVLGIDGGTSYDIMQAVRYAAGLDNDSGEVPDTPADIINLSLGGTGYSDTEQELYAEVQSTGIIVVAAAGNYASTIQSYPAAYTGVFSVSAVDGDGSLASYSSYGATIDVAAPGGDDDDYIYSTGGDDSSGSIATTYLGMQGTSMATPHVSGVAALLKSLKPDLTCYDFDALLRNGLITTDIGDSGRDDQYGYGLIDAASAVTWATTDGVVPTTLVSDPESLIFGTSSSSLTIEISASGSGDVGTISITSDEDWLTVAAEDIDSDGLGTYTVAVERTDLTPGSYGATLTVNSSADDIETIEVSVSMLVAASSNSIDGGHHYIRLLNPSTQDIVYETSGEFIDGELAYSFSSVSTGTYLIYAGTDMDNDDSIEDEGESFGAYPSTSQVQSFSVGQDIEGLDFSVQFSEIWHRFEE